MRVQGIPTKARGDPSSIDALLARVGEVAEAFSPSAPITNRVLFSGRVPQMAKLMNLVGQRGQHGVLYGESEVSERHQLAAVVSGILQTHERLTVRVNCGAGDSFSAVWRRVLSEVTLSTTTPRAGFGGQPYEADAGTAELLLGDDPVAPDLLRRALGIISESTKTVVFVDEFDRLDQEGRAAFADLIKSLSDYVVDATVVIVGVADNVDELVAEHRSGYSRHPGNPDATDVSQMNSSRLRNAD